MGGAEIYFFPQKNEALTPGQCMYFLFGHSSQWCLLNFKRDPQIVESFLFDADDTWHEGHRCMVLLVAQPFHFCISAQLLHEYC